MEAFIIKFILEVTWKETWRPLCDCRDLENGGTGRTIGQMTLLLTEGVSLSA